MLIRKIATISDELKVLIQSGNYEKYILSLMNKSKIIFPGIYAQNVDQSQSQCDFYEVKTLEKFEAKLPFDKREGKLICSNNANLKEWISFMMAEEEEFGDKIITHRGQYTVDSLQLYKTIEKRLKTVQHDENAILFFPYPITLDFEPVGDEVAIHQLVSDILSSIFRELKRNCIIGDRKVFFIYPSIDRKFVLRCMNDDTREYIAYEEMNSFFIYNFEMIEEET